MKATSLTVFAVFLGFMISSYNLSEDSSENIGLPSWVSDYMIFPSGIHWKLRGSCGSFQEVTARFSVIEVSVKADKDGIWEIDFPPIASGISDDLVFVCNGKKTIIKEALSGNIWLCAGQSNMGMPVSYSNEPVEAADDISLLNIRYFDGRQWIIVTDKNVQGISAVALFFAVEMEKSQKVPIGIFVAAKGGTGIESWMPVEAFPNSVRGLRFKALANDTMVLKAARDDEADFKPYGQHRLAAWGLGRAVPASLFNELIRPFGQMPLTGVVWYQGESNAATIDQAAEYHLWLENLIFSYRMFFNNPCLIFTIIQLPDYEAATSEERKAWTTLQNAQEEVANNTKQAIFVDIKDLGELDDIHPRRKKEVGTRTARAVCKLMDHLF